MQNQLTQERVQLSDEDCAKIQASLDIGTDNPLTRAVIRALLSDRAALQRRVKELEDDTLLRLSDARDIVDARDKAERRCAEMEKQNQSVTCAYCGHALLRSDPDFASKAAEHASTCEKNPIVKALGFAADACNQIRDGLRSIREVLVNVRDGKPDEQQARFAIEWIDRACLEEPAALAPAASSNKEQVCEWCNGTGSRFVRGNQCQCEYCEGSGSLPSTEGKQ